ncbi:MAG: 50S ribosomal protein L25 [Planctomycetaceae bacterium]|nr:50S ribosomal protein L25 [Planctomycetaceae bacterium]
MAEVLNVEVRNTRGTRHAQRLRQEGGVPGVLYGHGTDPVSLKLSGEQVALMVRHGSRLVELNGAVSEKAFVSELQWDTFGLEVLHIDLVRVSEDETITLEVTIELRGEAPGVREGGVIDHVVHQVEIECPVGVIPEKLSLSIKDLHLDGSITADKLPLPPGASLLVEPELVIVTCHTVAEEEEVTAGEAAEPEVIGRKAAEEGESEE